MMMKYFKVVGSNGKSLGAEIYYDWICEWLDTVKE